MSSPNLRDRLAEVSLDVDGERLERRNVERVDTPIGLACAPRFALREIDERGQESCQRLARAGRRDQQHRTAGGDLGQQFELVRARRPAARRKPAREGVGQRESRRYGGRWSVACSPPRPSAGTSSLQERMAACSSVPPSPAGKSSYLVPHAPLPHFSFPAPKGSIARPGIFSSTRYAPWSARWSPTDMPIMPAQATHM